MSNFYILDIYNMGLDARKPVFGDLRTTQRRPACAFAQSDQRFFYSRIEKYYI